jgi:AcrR family transcriptional regulator
VTVDGAEAEGGNLPEAGNTPKSRKGVRTRARLLEAAEHVFEQQGFLQARISDITDRAGLAHGSFYHYFDSKEQIFREVAEIADARLGQPLYDFVLRDSELSPAERLERAIRVFLENYRDHAAILGVVEQVSRYDDEVRAILRARRREHNALVVESIRQLQVRKMADPLLDPSAAASALGAMTNRFAEMVFSQDDVDVDFDTAVDTLVRLFVNALGVAPRGERQPGSSAEPPKKASNNGR